MHQRHEWLFLAGFKKLFLRSFAWTLHDILGSSSKQIVESLIIAHRLPNHTMSDNAAQMQQALLRISPLVLSSASVMFSWAQDIAFKAFLHPSLRTDPVHPSGKILPRYLPAFMKPGLWGIGLTFLPSTALCVANGMSRQGREVRNLYFAGAALSIAHFCWGPCMFRILASIGDAKTAGVANEAALESWRPRHHQRTLLVNVPAFLCIFAATLGSMAEGLR